MKLEHVAIWTYNLEKLKDYYINFFSGIPNEKYTNPDIPFQSCFLTFGSGTRLELMSMPGIPENQNDAIITQHLGIIHLAFGVASKNEVNQMAKKLKSHGVPILKGPRTTGDGYYEFETLDPDNNRIGVTTLA